MKTITEFSGILLQRAAEAQRAFRAEHPQTETRRADLASPNAEAKTTDVAAEEGAPVEVLYQRDRLPVLHLMPNESDDAVDEAYCRYRILRLVPDKA